MTIDKGVVKGFSLLVFKMSTFIPLEFKIPATNETEPFPFLLHISFGYM